MTNNLKGPGPGRPKGVKSILTEFKRSREYMIDIGFNPIEEAIKRYNNPKLKETTHNEMLGFLIKRWDPELRSVEVTGANGNPLETTRINVVYVSNNKPLKEIE